jgi:hypothetical protein
MFTTADKDNADAVETDRQVWSISRGTKQTAKEHRKLDKKFETGNGKDSLHLNPPPTVSFPSRSPAK